MLDATPRVPFRTVVISVLGLWATYFLLATLRWEVMDYGYSFEMVPPRIAVTVVGIMVTLVLWLLLRLFDARAIWIKAIAAILISMPAAILLAQTNTQVFSGMQETLTNEISPRERGSDGLFTEVPVDETGKSGAGDANGTSIEGAVAEEAAYIERIALLAFSHYFLLLAWCSLYFSLLAVGQVRLAERREQQFRNAAKAAELRSLRYQVNPHFLFNTLNSLSALVLTNKPERAEQMIQTISNFYRRSLADDPTGDVALEQEFDLQKLYLDIETVRFPERLRCVFDLPDDLAEARVPGMILQPLVENSVKYAVSAVNRVVTITVSAREEFDRLVITVSDDGPGTPKGGEHGFGIGLANVRDRLEARFGNDVVLASGSVPGGYKSEIRIPLTRNG
ncbi:MAG: histidine kinase [Erythrobacter sp. RIFCSPHIGHO2_12_FULL_63_10]|nr:MAG: histidine kinase [Erythrobacter sp. RIFCSPHIGHO2_12_FULL_63_10]